MPKQEKNDRLKDAQTAIDEIKKKYGDGAIMRFSESRAMDVPAVSTGSVSLDIALGVGNASW